MHVDEVADALRVRRVAVEAVGVAAVEGGDGPVEGLLQDGRGVDLVATADAFRLVYLLLVRSGCVNFVVIYAILVTEATPEK